MWTWQQTSGQMLNATGTLIGTGYAGRGDGLNDQAMQSEKGIGPLPRGKYTIGPLLSSHTVGNVVLVWCAQLTPDPANEMFDRAGFMIHGRKSLTDMDASEGCIVLDFNPRMQVLKSEDRDLMVVE